MNATRTRSLLPLALVALAAGTCESTIPNPLSEAQVARTHGQQLGLSLAALRVEDRDDAKLRRRDQPIGTLTCPGGGSRTINPDGSFELNGCALFPGFILNGTINVIQGDDEQDIRMEFANVTGQSNGRAFTADGYLEEMENADGSLDFSANFTATTMDDEYTDTTRIVGRVSVDSLGTMTGGFATPDECPTDLDCGGACNLNGVNILSLLTAPDGFDQAFRAACTNAAAIDCGFGTIPMVLINGSDEAANILTPEEIRGPENLLQPGGSRSVCVLFQAGGTLNVRVHSESGTFALKACPFTANPIFELKGTIQWTGELATFTCNGPAFE